MGISKQKIAQLRIETRSEWVYVSKADLIDMLDEIEAARLAAKERARP